MDIELIEGGVDISKSKEVIMYNNRKVAFIMSHR